MDQLLDLGGGSKGGRTIFLKGQTNFLKGPG
jgi:hypothetical protein